MTKNLKYRIYFTYTASPRTIVVHRRLNFFVYEVLELISLAYFYTIQYVNIQHLLVMICKINFGFQRSSIIR